jgi:hypothetical protein
MTEAPKLKLVDYALAEVPHKEQDEPVIRKILDRFGPSIAKKARQDERAGIFQALGAQNLEEASQLARVRAERDARPTVAEEQKHGRFRFYQGVVVGVCVGCAIVVAVGSSLLLAGSQASVQGVAAGSMVARQNENEDRMRALERNEPYTPGQP